MIAARLVASLALGLAPAIGAAPGAAAGAPGPAGAPPPAVDGGAEAPAPATSGAAEGAAGAGAGVAAASSAGSSPAGSSTASASAAAASPTAASPSASPAAAAPTAAASSSSAAAPAPAVDLSSGTDPKARRRAAARARADAREALNLDPGAILRNRWPVAPVCNLGDAPDVCLTLDAEVFAGYRLRSLAGERFGEFALDRSELGTSLWVRPHRRLDAAAVVRIEAIRSAGPQSLVGIDGDSLIIRLAQAFGAAAVHLGPIDVSARVGQVPERWIEQLEKGYDARGLDPLSSDRLVLFDRADLGASLTLSGWGGRVELDAAFTNGEGRAQVELNRGKNTTLIATARPLLRAHPKGPIVLALHGLYRDGSLGVAAVRAHRAAAAATFQSPWAFAGLEFVQAFGVGDRGDRTLRSIGAWASAYAYQPWVGVVAKVDRVRQDLGVAGSSVDVATAGVFSDVFGYAWRRRRRIRLYAAYQYEGYGPLAGPVPGAPQAADTHRFLLQIEAQGLVRAL